MMWSTILLLVSLASAPASAEDLRLFSVGSGYLDGGYFAATRAICEVVNRAEKGRLRCSPEATQGSVYNLVALRNRQLDLALAQSDWQRHALNGTSVFASRGPMPQLRSVMSLYPEPFNLIVRRGAGIGGIPDLVGKRVDIGQPSSGRQATMRAIMQNVGIKLSDLGFVLELPGSAAIDELCAGRIDATVLITGHPSKAIARALNECDGQLVSLGGREMDRLVAGSDDYSHASVAAGTYASLQSQVATFAVRATVVTISSMDDAIVEAFVGATLAHLDTLRQRVPILATLDIDAMRSRGLSAPLHPAAARIFEKAAVQKK